MSDHRRNDRCDEFDRLRPEGKVDDPRARRWQEHLDGCAHCREQVRADGLLRETLAAPAPELVAGFEERLRRRLESRSAPRPAAVGRPGLGRSSSGRPGLPRFGWWVLATYGTAAAVASAVILARLPWQSIAPSPAFGITLGALALLSPLVLLDRIGIVRPPG